MSLHKSSSDMLPPLGMHSHHNSALSASGASSDRLSSMSHSSSQLALPALLVKQQSVLHKQTHGVDLASLSQEEQRVVGDFRQRVSSSPNTAIAVCAIQTLTSVVRASTSETMMGLQKELNQAIDALKACNPASISLAAGCELFSCYVTRAARASDIPNFRECVQRLIERGEQFAAQSINSRTTIAELVDRFISDSKVVLTHGYSRVVQSVLLHAAALGKNFSVIVTEGRPNCDGYHAAAELVKAGIPVTLILDSAMAYSMDQVDLILLGAEGVAESGGIINKIGTYQMCLCATTLKKPVYVAAESYKFARLFPLNQADLPETKEQQRTFKPACLTSEQASDKDSSSAAAASAGTSAATPATVAASAEFLFSPSTATTKQYAEKLLMSNPSCDYTPPEFLTLLFTDIGILTPSAVSDELIKLYYDGTSQY